MLQQGHPFSSEETAEIIARFDHDGFAFIPGVLTVDEIEGLKTRIDRAFDDPRTVETENRGGYTLVRAFELDTMFRDLMVREPIISVVEAICGDDCHLIADGVIRNGPGEAIAQWHVDDPVFLPLPEEIPRHDPRVRLPVFQMTVQILLTDVPSDEYGPTQFVPGSHYSGRFPNDQHHPEFEGKGPVSILGRAGDIYLQNGQCWHRGAPNTSDRTRYLYQLAYAPRWVSQRFYPFLNYHMPERVLAGADERLLRVLGKHPKGAYG
jgi:ectoine hydroxylase-related dioxygenase (phytanoyl-CoA dioxygenase family)